jgi:hypothetical protein
MRHDMDDENLDRLFAAARRAEPYRSEIEYGFETRLMAKIRARNEGRAPYLLWSWRLIPVFISLIILIGIWTYTAESPSVIDINAITRIGNEEAMLTAFLTGE